MQKQNNQDEITEDEEIFFDQDLVPENQWIILFDPYEIS